jgi:aspartyl-tRNA synthetase
MLCGANSIRDVIAFPKSATGRDLLVNAPANVTNEQLNEYKIMTKV